MSMGKGRLVFMQERDGKSSLTCELLGGLWVLVRAHGGCS